MRKNLFSRTCSFIVTTCFVFSLTAASALAMEPKPTQYVEDAVWWKTWGVVQIVPAIVKQGSTLMIHGSVVGGPAADPYWGCTEWGWSPNGTHAIGIYCSQLGVKDLLTREAGDPPPLGWKNRISDTCYCSLSAWGASGGCKTREVYPTFFERRVEQEPGFQFNRGHKTITTVNPPSYNYWKMVVVEFSGTAGVGHSDAARDYVYVLGDLTALEEDSDGDGLPDVWEIAHDPALGSGDPLGKFSGGPVESNNASLSSSGIMLRQASSGCPGTDPYAPRGEDWVRVSPNDWDGDRTSNKDEYLKWYNNELDEDGVPYDPTVINSSAALNACPDCSGDAVVLKDTIFLRGSTCECVGTTSITVGPGVTVQCGATVTFTAPTVKLQLGFYAEEGSTVYINPL